MTSFLAGIGDPFILCIRFNGDDTHLSSNSYTDFQLFSSLGIPSNERKIKQEAMITHVYDRKFLTSNFPFISRLNVVSIASSY